MEAISLLIGMGLLTLLTCLTIIIGLARLDIPAQLGRFAIAI